MKKLLLLAIFCLSCGIIIGLSFNASAQESQSIPSWVKNTAKFWVNGEVDDADFIKAIQWMVTNGIIQLPSNSSTTQQTQTTQHTTSHDQAEYKYQARMAQIPQDTPSPVSQLSDLLPTASDVSPYGYQLKGSSTTSDIFDENGATQSIQQTYVKPSVSPQSRIIISAGTYKDDLTTLNQVDSIYATLSKDGFQSGITSSNSYNSYKYEHLSCHYKGLSGPNQQSISYYLCSTGNTLFLFENDVNLGADKSYFDFDDIMKKMLQIVK